jgi:NADH-quinone oxidoreductase subunit M
MLGFFVAFAVKLPALPLHGWLPDAHSQANTAGSVLLAGLLIKVGAYGFLRFLIALFPEASADMRGVAMGLGVAGILYGAVMAFAQTDLKRLVAYTSVSHMGFVLLGVFAANELALQGVVLQIVCHAFSTGGLFILAGVLEERLETRELGGMGGLWARLSTLGGFGMVLAMAALGLPGLGNFVAEFLILLGTFQVSRPAAIIGSLGLVLSTVYAVWLVQRVFHGPEPAGLDARTAGLDARTAGPAAPASRRRWGLSAREILMFAVAVIVLLWLGLYPQTLVRTVEPANDFLLRAVAGPVQTSAAPAETGSAVGPAAEPKAASDAAGRAPAAETHPAAPTPAEAP